MFFKEIITDPLLLSIYICFVCGFCVQMFYHWGVFSKLAFYKATAIELSNKSVSVVICAKNEYVNLKKNLPLILEQAYHNFEVVVVNDCSDDDSHYFLKALAERYPHLNVVTIERNVNFFTGKKFALALGIKSAKHDWLLLTDADCSPKSDNWIAEMQKHFIGKTEIVLGYSGFEKRKGLMNKIIRYEMLMTAVQYLSWSLKGKTYMGVGRNLAYHRKLFYKNKGFTSHYHIMSGDDDLFINQVATKNNTSIEIAEESQTVSVAKATFSEWLKQKKRHYSAGVLYKTKHKVMLGIFPFSNFLFNAAFVFLIINFIKTFSLYNIIIVCALLVLKVSSQMYILKKSMNKLSEKDLLLISPLFDLLFVLVYPLIAFSNKVIKKNKWN